MATSFQVTFDAHDPHRLGDFWAQVLGYVDQPPPGDFPTWEAFLDARGVPAQERDRAWSVVDPDGVGPRLFFQRVPEGKTAKNRMHLDVSCSGGLSVPAEERRQQVEARAAELVELGARRVRGPVEEMGSIWIVLQDPEGNEFCLQ